MSLNKNALAVQAAKEKTICAKVGGVNDSSDHLVASAVRSQFPDSCQCILLQRPFGLELDGSTAPGHVVPRRPHWPGVARLNVQLLCRCPAHDRLSYLPGPIQPDLQAAGLPMPVLERDADWSIL